MSNGRLDDDVCLSCGDPLIYPFNEYHMCSKCTRVVMRAIYETKMRDRRGPKKGKPIAGGRLHAPLEPIGVPVE